MAVFKKERKMKVYAQSGYKYKDTATIILKGEWLRDCGFEPGTPISVCCEEGRLLIYRIDECGRIKRSGGINSTQKCEIAYLK